MAIQNLTKVTTLNPADLVALFSNSVGGDVAATLTTLLTWLQTQLSAASGFISQYETPLTGFSVTVSPFVPGGNVFLLLTPAGTLAAGTLNMPSMSSSVHGQEVMVHSTQVVTALTVSGNGAGVSGLPSALAAGGFFRARYDAINKVWYRVG